MKLYSSVREILSAVLSVVHLPNVMDIIYPENVGIDAHYVCDHSFDVHAKQ